MVFRRLSSSAPPHQPIHIISWQRQPASQLKIEPVRQYTKKMSSDYHLEDPIISNNESTNKEDDCCDCCCFLQLSGCCLLGTLAGAVIMFLIFHQGQYAPYQPTNNNSNTSYGCSRASDVTILLELGSEFNVKQQDCIKHHRTTHVPLVKCLESSTGVSETCAAAFAGLTKCVKEKCLLVCVGTGGAFSPKCLQCFCGNCRQPMLDRVKIPCTLLPDGPHNCGDCPAHAPYQPPTPSMAHVYL